MPRLYLIIFVLTLYCLYHAWTKKAEQKWIWIILFLPVIGSALYLYDAFAGKGNIGQVTDSVLDKVKSTHKLEKLEKEVANSATTANRTLLADAYMELGRHEDAVPFYLENLKGHNPNDFYTHQRLVAAFYLSDRFAEAVQYGDKIAQHREFGHVKEKIAYAWSYAKLGQTDKAEAIFKEMDSRYSNYPQRIEYAKFLHETGRTAEAIAFLEKLNTEYDNMDTQERKQKRDVKTSLAAAWKEIN